MLVAGRSSAAPRSHATLAGFDDVIGKRFEELAKAALKNAEHNREEGG
jgi:hypothetical protein